MSMPKRDDCRRMDVFRRAVAEALGTAFLLAAVVGSGIMGERLAGGNTAIALLANTIATGAALVALILTFGAISGAHFNPAVTLADASQGGLAWREVPVYIAAQIFGAFAGVAAAHTMFSEPLFFFRTTLAPEMRSSSASSSPPSDFSRSSGVARGYGLPQWRLRWGPTSPPRTGLPPLRLLQIRL
jgi:glycerol uptake facilitator-like aquaporin